MEKIVRNTIVMTFILFMVYVNYNFLLEINFNKIFGQSTADENSEKIGTVSIYSSMINFPTPKRLTGHSWIYIYNETDTAFYVSDIFVPPKKGITFSTTANPVMGYTGLWANVEAYNSAYLDNISLTGDFYYEDIAYVEQYLKFHNKWNIVMNCTTFSCELWNNLYAGKDNKLRAFTPEGLYYEILQKNDFELDKSYDVFGYMKAMKQ